MFYDPSLGDLAGNLKAPTEQYLTSAADFAAWYRDVPGFCGTTSLRWDRPLR